MGFNSGFKGLNIVPGFRVVSRRRLGFDHRSFHVRSVVENVTLRRELHWRLPVPDCGPEIIRFEISSKGHHKM